MWRQYSIFIFAISCLLHTGDAKEKCVTVEGVREGNISHAYQGPRDNSYYRCWNILNPERHLLRIAINHTYFFGKGCGDIYLEIEIDGKRKRFCSSDDLGIFQTHFGAKVNFYANYYTFDVSRPPNFVLLYKFDTGISGVEGMESVRMQAIYWVKSRLSSSWAWIENVSKAVTGLFLADGATFNGTSTKEQLMVEQRNLRTSVALLRDTASIEQLSVFINSLLVTCHNPRQFYGQNLIKLLKERLEVPDNYTHPTAYLALCNANETWPQGSYYDLSYIFNLESEYPIVRDVQALAIMAISCKINKRKVFNTNGNDSVINLYRETIQRLKKKQLPNGSFGNAHSTALITQALVSSGSEYDEGWKVHKAIKFLMKELNTSSVNFLTTYSALPLLKGRTLADIGSINCSGRSRNHDDLISEIHDYLGKKMTVQYSLFLGDNKEVIHTISLKVPQNFTAYDVMQFAEVQDSKYKFLWERVNGEMYVYDIAKIPNDPEERKFWMLYVAPNNSTGSIRKSHLNPDKLVLKNGDHLIMWYKTADF